MNLFKNMIWEDLTSVFFNPDEFSEIHTITTNGTTRKVRAIIDKDQLINRTGGKSSDYKGGIYLDQILIYVHAEDYGAKPAVGKVITLDGKKIYKIVDVDAQNGLYILTLEVNKV